MPGAAPRGKASGSLRPKKRHHAHVFQQPDAAFVRHLEQEGYAVLRDALGDASRAAFLQLFWRAARRVVPKLRLRDRSTWRFPTGYRGIMAAYGLAQSDFAWIPRMAPKVQKAFAAAFKVPTSELVVSLDAVLLSESLPKKRSAPWLHKDQRHDDSLGLSVQGIYTAGAVKERDAGTVLVPGSHRQVYAWERRRKNDPVGGQHVRVPERELAKLEAQMVKPYMPANSLLLFNSRLVHANTTGTKRREEKGPGNLPLPNRLALAVCYAPRRRRSEETRTRKEEAYLAGKTANHWPCDRFSLKRPRLWDYTKGGRKLPKPPRVAKRLALL